MEERMHCRPALMCVMPPLPSLYVDVQVFCHVAKVSALQHDLEQQHPLLQAQLCQGQATLLGHTLR